MSTIYTDWTGRKWRKVEPQPERYQRPGFFWGSHGELPCVINDAEGRRVDPQRPVIWPAELRVGDVVKHIHGTIEGHGVVTRVNDDCGEYTVRWEREHSPDPHAFSELVLVTPAPAEPKRGEPHVGWEGPIKDAVNRFGDALLGWRFEVRCDFDDGTHEMTRERVVALRGGELCLKGEGDESGWWSGEAVFRLIAPPEGAAEPASDNSSCAQAAHCDTCQDTREVYQEPQHGVPGSGGESPCPDCTGGSGEPEHEQDSTAARPEREVEAGQKQLPERDALGGAAVVCGHRVCREQQARERLLSAGYAEPFDAEGFERVTSHLERWPCLACPKCGVFACLHRGAQVPPLVRRNPKARALVQRMNMKRRARGEELTGAQRESEPSAVETAPGVERAIGPAVDSPDELAGLMCADEPAPSDPWAEQRRIGGEG